MPMPLNNSGVAPVGAAPSALMTMTLPVFGLWIRAWVSPPQLRVSHMVAAAPSMAQAASTALPPLANVSAPAEAASGLPVMATQWLPCSGGLLECLGSCACSGAEGVSASNNASGTDRATVRDLRAKTGEFRSNIKAPDNGKTWRYHSTI